MLRIYCQSVNRAETAKIVTTADYLYGAPSSLLEDVVNIVFPFQNLTELYLGGYMERSWRDLYAFFGNAFSRLQNLRGLSLKALDPFTDWAEGPGNRYEDQIKYVKTEHWTFASRLQRLEFPIFRVQRSPSPEKLSKQDIENVIDLFSKKLMISTQMLTHLRIGGSRDLNKWFWSNEPDSRITPIHFPSVTDLLLRIPCKNFDLERFPFSEATCNNIRRLQADISTEFDDNFQLPQVSVYIPSMYSS